MHVLSTSFSRIVSPAGISLARILILLVVTLPLAQVRAEEQSEEITVDAVIAEMNVYRGDHGLPLLQGDQRLHRAAEDRIDDMERQGYWGHYPPDGSSPFLWLPLRGYHYRQAGENLAAGLESLDLLVSSWMSSPGHRANILSPEYADVGIGIIDGGTTGRRSGKSVVVLFAAERGKR